MTTLFSWGNSMKKDVQRGLMSPILNGIGDILKRIRPNIMLGMIIIAVLGMVISYIGWQMGMEGIISAAGVGSIVAISNLAGKILETERGSGER